MLRLLEGSQGRSLQDLVESVPDDYPKNTRTVRRDLEALGAVGFPLIAERRNGQTRWRLIEGVRDIPALGFSATELMALLLSRNLLKPLEGTEIAESLDSALSKASAWVRDKSWHPSQESKLMKDGRLKLTLRVADNEELVGWILSFGSQVKVVGPEALRQRVMDEAKKIIVSSR